MKSLRNNEGQMRVIETIISAFIILSAITFVNVYSTLPASHEYEMSDLEKMGHNIFHDLDEHGVLIQFVYGTEEEQKNLMPVFMLFFPPDLYCDLTIYDRDYNLLNNFPIRFGNPEVFQNSNSTVSVTYLLPGNGGEYNPRILRLQLVRG